MSRTWSGHDIHTIDMEDYIEYKDYLELEKEIERLNNIINELEQWLKRQSGDISYAYKHTLDKLKELRGDSNVEDYR